MKYTKTRLVKSPSRGTSKSAGIDFYVPEFDERFINDLLDKNPNLKKSTDNEFDKNSHVLLNDCVIILKPGDRILIPSGIHVNFNDEAYQIGQILGDDVGLSLNAYNKSGIGSKKGLDLLAQVVDNDYTGEIHINLVNTSNDNVMIFENEKIIQFLLQPVIYNEFKEIKSLNELYKNTSTERGDGGFGSTNKK